MPNKTVTSATATIVVLALLILGMGDFHAQDKPRQPPAGNKTDDNTAKLIVVISTTRLEGLEATDSHVLIRPRGSAFSPGIPTEGKVTGHDQQWDFYYDPNKPGTLLAEATIGQVPNEVEIRRIRQHYLRCRIFKENREPSNEVTSNRATFQGRQAAYTSCAVSVLPGIDVLPIPRRKYKLE